MDWCCNTIIGVILLVQGKQATSSVGSIVGEILIFLSCLAWGLYLKAILEIKAIFMISKL